jgi:predicted RNase H-like HicB family nuclease
MTRITQKNQRKSVNKKPIGADKERLVFHRISGDSCAMEIVFSVMQESDGGYVAECLSHDIFTQGNTWEELRSNVREAVSAYFFDQPKPATVRLHLVRDELLASA